MPEVFAPICPNSMRARGPSPPPAVKPEASNEDEHPMLPVFDIGPHLNGCTPEEEILLAQGIADSLQRTGCVIVRDPRVAQSDNQRFLNTMETYFARGTAVNSADCRPELHYQVGATPEGVEIPLAATDTALQALIAQQPAHHRASPFAHPDPSDPKWRFMWRIGPRPTTTAFAELNADPVVPAGLTGWTEIMDQWGAKMLAAALSTAHLAAVGLGLRPEAFTSLMKDGPHLLGPTGADLGKHRAVGTVLAGFHSDLNFLTIHGKSRFPGLHVWLRDGTRAAVKVPHGCLFIQAGQQLEYLTGGTIQAGMHEVVVTQGSLQAVDASHAAGRPPWRVSSTVFAHIASDQTLTPLAHFATSDATAQYPPIAAGLFVEQELKKIKLAPHK